MTWRDVYVEFQADNTAQVQLPPSCKTMSCVELVGYRVLNWNNNPSSGTERNLALEIKELPPSELLSNLPQHDRIFAVINHTDNGSPNFTNRSPIASQMFRPQKIAQLTFKVYQTQPFAGDKEGEQRMAFQQLNTSNAVNLVPRVELWLRILVNQDPNYSN